MTKTENTLLTIAFWSAFGVGVGLGVPAPNASSSLTERFSVAAEADFNAVAGAASVESSILNDLESESSENSETLTLASDVASLDLSPPPTGEFPELGANSDLRRATLRNLVKRAKKYGIDVYLYMNEPRALPASFFENRPHIRGVAQEKYFAMCASTPETRRWLVDSLAAVFADVPGLGGFPSINLEALQEFKDETTTKAEVLDRLATRVFGAEGAAIGRDEIELAKALRRVAAEDFCVGFESTNQYWFVPNDLVEKIISCR